MGGREKTMIAAVAAIAGLAFPAVAGAKVVTYAGTVEGGGNIALDVKVNKEKKPKAVLEARGTEFALKCEQSGEITGFTRFPERIDVTRRGKFSASYEQPGFGNQSSIEGRFKPKKRVNGSFVFDYHFPEEGGFPEEDCTTGRVDYTATRGAEDGTQPFPPPQRR